LPRFDALVLAGSRADGDPLARAQGVRHRALIEVGGEPMLLRVVRTLHAVPALGRVRISIDDPTALDGIAEFDALRRRGALDTHTSLDSPSRSVLDVLEDGNAPLLVTTADHPLLTPEVAAHFLSSCETVAADLVVGLVEREIVEDRFPTTARTWLHFRDGDYTGANLFGFRTRAARRAPAFWTRVENLRKRPWRMVSAFGPVALALFLARRLSLDAALERASQAIGARVGAVRLPYPEAAVDVDRASDLELAERILAERNRGPS
jgi:GTP:adenosylcobinamide-phosphate guanylyltransferase